MATTVYNTVFNNSLSKWTQKLVPAAVTAAGLDESKVPDLLTALSSSPTTLAQSFGDTVAAAAVDANKHATCKAVL